MSEDARFEDGAERPLNLGALEAGDLKVLSALVQDAVFPASEMRYVKAGGRFALLLNRFRWEGGARAPERVQSVLMIANVDKVVSSGVPRGDGDTILSLLSVEFSETDAPSGQVTLTLAGDGALRLDVEALDVTLKDVTRPYLAPSKKTPDHGV
ncbi:DUF2948 family protein [Planktotalea arctica]|uniref:DUF2948 family protein n=1 Tax=Planktotalea arctica TaxID=1481893 RepID=UPI000A171E6E|nr:DUF2948 family protein [Planktotalea arctica]